MFRIDRNLVKLGDTKTVRTIQVDNEFYINNENTEAGVAGGSPDAAASAAAMANVILSTAEVEAKAKAHEILKEAKAEAAAKASVITENARKEAAAIILAAREQAEEELRSAHIEGFNEGAEEGRRSYDERLETKVRELDDEYDKRISGDDEKLKRVIDELYNERTNTFDGLEEKVVGLALEVVRKVINPSEERFGGVFEMLIKNALKQINPEGKVIIRVSSAEYERFFSSGSVLFELDRGVSVTASVLRDASLGEGDCVIDTEDETINAGFDSQLKYIQLAFDRADGY